MSNETVKPPSHILIVEDDAEIARLVQDLLSAEGFEISHAVSGEKVDELVEKNQPDLIILDLMLPGEDGLSICRRLRARSRVAILMLTAKSDDIDRVVGLEMGADDYLAKPFHPRELLARVRAILRRTNSGPSGQNAQGVQGVQGGAGADGAANAGEGMFDPEAQNRRFGFEDFIIDLDARDLQTSDGVPITLTSTEFDLLACFVQRPRRVLSRDQLLDWLHGRESDPFDRSIDMTVSRLRKKIEAARAGVSLISTIRNNGYLFVPAVKQLS